MLRGIVPNPWNVPVTLGIQQPLWQTDGPSGNRAEQVARPMPWPYPSGYLRIAGQPIYAAGTPRVANTASPVNLSSILPPGVIAGLMKAPNSGAINY
jgi:hypothetical protein